MAHTRLKCRSLLDIDGFVKGGHFIIVRNRGMKNVLLELLLGFWL